MSAGRLLAGLYTAESTSWSLPASIAVTARRSYEGALAAALRRENSRMEAAEAPGGLIDSMVLTPQAGEWAGSCSTTS